MTNILLGLDFTTKEIVINRFYYFIVGTEYEKPATRTYELIKIESKILTTLDNQKNSWLLIGQYLYLVDKFELYKQNEIYSSYTKWLNSIADKVNLKKSTLWKYKKIVTMINELELAHEEINSKNVTGLEQVARIYSFNKDHPKAMNYINLLNDKKIKTIELTQIYKNLSKNNSNLESNELLVPATTSLKTDISNFFDTIFMSKTVFNTLSIMAMVLTIYPIN